MNSNILSSWKEISAYTGFSERTLQRWEQRFGFPVHRPAGKTRSAVSALITEIDAWLSSAPSLPEIRQTFARYPGKLVHHLGQQSEQVGRSATSASDSPSLASRSAGEARLAHRAQADQPMSSELTDILVSGVGRMKLLMEELTGKCAELSTLRAELAKTCEASARVRQRLESPPPFFSMT
jgi:predicted DNA-binding transcriptional regulator AlpA